MNDNFSWFYKERFFTLGAGFNTISYSILKVFEKYTEYIHYTMLDSILKVL